MDTLTAPPVPTFPVPPYQPNRDRRRLLRAFIVVGMIHHHLSIAAVGQENIFAEHNGVQLVSVPQPARYAVHKLIIATRRERPADKVRKDIAQATELFIALAEDRPD